MESNGTKKIYTATVNGKRIGCFVSSVYGNDGWMVFSNGAEMSYSNVHRWESAVRCFYDEESVSIDLKCKPE